MAADTGRKPQLEFTQGDGLALVVSERIAGFPRDLSGFTFRAQVRTPRGDLVADLIPDPVDLGAGAYRLRAVETASWPAGRVVVTIERTDPGGVLHSTPAFSVLVKRDGTR